MTNDDAAALRAKLLEALTVDKLPPCPRCGAEGYRHCLTPSGRYRDAWHVERAAVSWQAIFFPAGRAVYDSTSLGMVMIAFDRAVEELIKETG